MPIIQFTEKDILRGKVLTPSWYRLRVEAAGEKRSKDGGSTNYPMEAVVIKDSDTGATEYAGVPLEWNFNSKAMSFARGFIEILSGTAPEIGKRYDLADAVGCEIDAFVEPREFEGRMLNNVTGKFRKPR